MAQYKQCWYKRCTRPATREVVYGNGKHKAYFCEQHAGQGIETGREMGHIILAVNKIEQEESK